MPIPFKFNILRFYADFQKRWDSNDNIWFKKNGYFYQWNKTTEEIKIYHLDNCTIHAILNSKEAWCIDGDVSSSLIKLMPEKYNNYLRNKR